MEREGINALLRTDELNQPLITDNGNNIVDCYFEAIPYPKEHHHRLISMPTVLETGLFVDFLDTLIVASTGGVEVIHS